MSPAKRLFPHVDLHGHDESTPGREAARTFVLDWSGPFDLTDIAVAERRAEAMGPQRLDGPNGYHNSMLRQGGDTDQPVVTPCSLSIGEELGLV
jgi:hypothetical protein